MAFLLASLMALADVRLDPALVAGVVDAAKFSLVEPRMTKKQVEGLLGPSQFVMAFGNARHTVWIYTYPGGHLVRFDDDGEVTHKDFRQLPPPTQRAPAVPLQ